jgi:hypothetical protein
MECHLQESDEKIGKKDIISEHIPNSYLFVRGSPFIDRNPECYCILKICGDKHELMHHFNNDLVNLAKEYYTNIMKKNEPAIYNEESINKFKAETSCHICGEEFTNNNKVYDHCHVTGKYRGAAHDNCNLHLSMPKFMPVFIHNLKYDSKIFIE